MAFNATFNNISVISSHWVSWQLKDNNLITLYTMATERQQLEYIGYHGNWKITIQFDYIVYHGNWKITIWLHFVTWQLNDDNLIRLGTMATDSPGRKVYFSEL